MIIPDPKELSGDELQEFALNPPDDLLPYYFPDNMAERTEDGVAALVRAVLPFFDKCYEWEVRGDAACVPAEADPHRVYGRRCRNHTFSNTECVDGGCEEGYNETSITLPDNTTRTQCRKRDKNIQRGRLLMEFHLSMERTKAEIAEKDAKLAELDAVLAEKEPKIAEKNAVLAEQDENLVQMDANHAEAEVTIAEFKTRYAEFNKTIVMNTAKLAKIQARIAKLQRLMWLLSVFFGLVIILTFIWNLQRCYPHEDVQHMKEE